MGLKQEMKQVKEKQKSMEADLYNKLKERADANQDGTTTAAEWFKFIITNPKSLILIGLLIMLNPLREFFMVGAQTGVWNWTQLVSAGFSSLTMFIFYIITKSSDKQNLDTVNELKRLHAKDVKTYEDQIDLLTRKNERLRDENQALKTDKTLLERENDWIKKYGQVPELPK
jgi:hypothetical protein